VDYKELASTGVRLPEIGLGTWQYRGSLEPLRLGVRLGATLIDTAEAYYTEGYVADAVKGNREQVFIATKVSGDHLRHDQLLKAAEGSLKKLGTDYIDLYQVHWPDPSVPIQETMRAMEELVDMGKVRYIGVSNFSVEDLQEAQAAMTRHRIVSNQVPYSLLHREIEESVLPYCAENDVTVIAYSPLELGALTARPARGHRPVTDALHQVAEETGKSMSQVALNWCICQPNVVAIPRSSRAEHVEENCGASGWRLSAEQVETLNRWAW
jgi:diketogulonate reductase-like aldo/keto reductase